MRKKYLKQKIQKIPNVITCMVKNLQIFSNINELLHFF